ncbi:M81 family metallopeptidase [Paenibacillus baekrokdamisoli]|nr:M81 family metallopeptidase [Paenibacillus baekrokdamisoli]
MKTVIAVAGIFHETNTFAPGQTGEEAFREEWVCDLDQFVNDYRDTQTTMGGLIDAADKCGVRLSSGLYTAALPSGMVRASVADLLLDAIIESLDDHAHGLVLIMHGAMVSENYEDFEGECLRRIREHLGREIPIVLTLDLHANISHQMVDFSDLIIAYKTYPHIDMYERGVEALEFIIRMQNKEVHPVQAYAHTGMLLVPQGMVTSEGSMKELMEQAFSMEQMDKVLNVTVAGGFPYSDIKDAGMSFVVTTDNDQALADKCSQQLLMMAAERRETFQVSYYSPQEAIEQALHAVEGPVILVEGSDNVGGGAPADATHLLKHLVGITVPTLIVIRDIEAVKAAAYVGIGATFSHSIGGKSDRLHGAPVYIEGKVRHLFDGAYHYVGPFRKGQLADMGMTAVIEAGLLTVVLTEKRTAPWDLGHIRYAGLWPADYKIIVVKSAVAWQTAFGLFAKEVINVDTPGCCSANLQHFHYDHARGLIAPHSLE